MLLEYGFKNYFSFREGAVVSFRLGRNVPRQISGGRSEASVLCVKGANASGKTSVLRAISFICDFAMNSFSGIPDGPLPFNSFFGGESIPTEFYVEFKINGTEYRYELVATENEVIREDIYRTKKKRTKIIGRTKNRLTTCNKEFERLKSMKLRRNVSLISHARQHEFKELDDLILFFGCVIKNVAFRGFLQEDDSDNGMAEFYHSRPDLLAFARNFIADCDTGIKDIKVLKRTDEENKSVFFPVFYHGLDSSFPVTTHTESSGTRALFRRLAGYKLALDTGGLIVADEMDIHLHPQIFIKLVELFLSQGTNKGGGQLLFTTHNSDVMDIVGRYRTVLVQKEENESFLYRLDEIPGDILRNDRPVSPIYKEGRIGGVPKL